jgi:hypothetical protein
MPRDSHCRALPVPPARLCCSILSQIRHMRANLSFFRLRAGLRRCRRGQFTTPTPPASAGPRLQLRLLLLHPQQQGLHLRALQERHRQTVRGCSPMSLRQYALQHPHRYVLRASLGLFERGLFVHYCPARVCLIAANNRLRISVVGADRCRFVCRSSNTNWRSSSCALRCVVRASLGAVG